MAAAGWSPAVRGDVSTYCQSIFLTYTRILDPLTSPQERTEHQKVDATAPLFMLHVCMIKYNSTSPNYVGLRH